MLQPFRACLLRPSDVAPRRTRDEVLVGRVATCGSPPAPRATAIAELNTPLGRAAEERPGQGGGPSPLQACLRSTQANTSGWEVTVMTIEIKQVEDITATWVHADPDGGGA